MAVLSRRWFFALIGAAALPATAATRPRRPLYPAENLCPAENLYPEG
jgi:hypothetical protein